MKPADKPNLEIIKDFVVFPKTPRLNRTIIITEKLDGANAQLYITEDNQLYTGTRTQWVYPGADYKGFANWAHSHREELLQLGPGRHYGEWWGAGLGRNYGLKEKRFSLFNTRRWALHGTKPLPLGPTHTQDTLPACCGLVPVLYDGLFSEVEIKSALERLRLQGSVAAPGFSNPEGIIVFHEAARCAFKVTLDNDRLPKTAA